MRWEALTVRPRLDRVRQSPATQAARDRMLTALIARVSAGDQLALESLYDETSAHVYSVALLLRPQPKPDRRTHR